MLKISNFVGRQSNKEIISVARNIITNLHHDKVLSKISTEMLVNLMKQYISAYPSLILSTQNIKQIVKEVSKRNPNFVSSFIAEKLILTSINN